MSEKTADLRATLKAGTGYDAPWLTVDAATPDELEFKLKALAEGGALEAVVNAANMLKAVNNAAPIAAEVASPPPAAPQQGWSQPAAQAPVEPSWGHRPQQQAAPAAQPGVQLHPEGITCPVDGNVVQFKQTKPRASDGKSFQFWTCPNQRSKGDGHYSQFAD